MKENSIKLNMDMSNMGFIQGTAKSISGGENEEYVSKIDMVLPIKFTKIPVEIYYAEYDGAKVDIKISTIEKQEDDIVFNSAKKLNIDASGSGLEMIPFKAFTDNRGKYPAISATLVFHKRIASWVDDSHVTGMKMDYDYEKIQVTGIPDNEEKVATIVVLNRLIKALKIEDLKGISYDDVTAFLETYFKKPSKKPLLIKTNALMSKEAYKNAVYDYVLPNLKDSNVFNSANILMARYKNEGIDDEKGLKSVIEEVIEEVLKHHIELRRWIEPFWNGQRKLKYKGNEIIVPRKPKGETKIQPTLHVILDMVLEPMGIHVSRESDVGSGLLDFQFFFTTKAGVPLSVGIEFKLAHHAQIKKGINTQLPTYLKSIRSTSGIFAIMWFKDTEFFDEPKKYKKNQMEQWINEQAVSVSSKFKMDISAVMIDASIRKSASNL